MTFDVLTICMLLGTGVIAGFVDSMVGGGGLITLPVLLHFGLTPQDALGTNKLQSSFGSGIATWRYFKGNWLNVGESKNGIYFTFLGAALGTLLVQFLSTDFLRRIIPILLTIIAVYLLFRPDFGIKNGSVKMKPLMFYSIFGISLGFYDGFFGPGTGTFWTMALIFCLGMPFTMATAQTKLMNFTSNLTSLIIFMIGGHVMFLAGLIMGAGQFCGAYFGARFAMKKGVAIIRPMFIAVVCVIILKLLYQTYF